MVDDLTADQALWRFRTDEHSIWEIVVHLTFWKRITYKLIYGHDIIDEVQEDWERIETGNNTTWQAVIEQLQQAQATLGGCAKNLSDESLEQAPSEYQHWPAWLKNCYATWGEALMGAIAHDCYHAGQIVKLRNLQGV